MARVALVGLFFASAGTSAAGASLLVPLDTKEPDENDYPHLTSRTHFPPNHTDVEGPKNTNKFWTHWVIDAPDENPAQNYPIFVAPWSLKWMVTDQSNAQGLIISNRNPMYEFGDTYETGEVGDDRCAHVVTPFEPMITVAAVETMAMHYRVRSEGLFGINVTVAGPPGEEDVRSMEYPIYTGMAFVSVRFRGSITPRVIGTHYTDGWRIIKARPGIWDIWSNNYARHRVYALTPDGNYVDDSYNIWWDTLTAPLDGWIRIARVNDESDIDLLDVHARKIVTGVELGIEDGGVVEYHFQTEGDSSVDLLHFGYKHHVDVVSNAMSEISPIQAPTKGKMQGILGETWRMQLDLTTANGVTMLPSGARIPEYPDHEAAIRQALLTDWEFFRVEANWKAHLLARNSYYFSGKGFQKVSMVCLMLEEFFGADDSRVQECADILSAAFACMYDHPDITKNACDSENGPLGLIYDAQWHGLVNLDGYTMAYENWTGTAPCWNQDFGNACYNDHHYHYGYFIVSAAVLVHLNPTEKDNADFVDFVTFLIRDTTNPSSEDPWFPRFRGFDWFEFHSWSRGLAPLPPGKDQESTSEDLNLMFGLVLWGREIGNAQLESLAATAMTANAIAIGEYFLMKDGNENHLPAFAKNHVTGIFFQSEIKYTTWFGAKVEYIHGIQMLPLSPALRIVRTPEFCEQEWNDVLKDLAVTNDPDAAWWSVLLTGALAIFNPSEAWTAALAQNVLDDGLTRSWVLYWIASLVTTAPTEAPPLQEGPTSMWYTIAGSLIAAAIIIPCLAIACQSNGQQAGANLGQELAAAEEAQ